VPDFAHVSERYRACSTMPMPKNRKPRAAQRRSRRSHPLIRNAIVRSNYAARRPGHPGPHRHKVPDDAGPPDAQLSAPALHLPTPRTG
jgi:hypothetical protein